MIEIYLSENYDKDLLKAELKWIKETASRELTYDVNRSPGLDVHISPFRYTKDEVEERSSFSEFEDDVCVFIAETWIHEYRNGKSIGVDSMEEYVKEM
ncbi:Terminal repeat-encoded protein [Staphylococcus phage Stab20]|nr:terminal repeat-encoded protein [Staphylococcus phage Stab20]VEV88333.1 Terminal repeat-encoded protein [Staphylococcus phage Stab20]